MIANIAKNIPYNWTHVSIFPSNELVPINITLQYDTYSTSTSSYHYNIVYTKHAYGTLQNVLFLSQFVLPFPQISNQLLNKASKWKIEKENWTQGKYEYRKRLYLS